MKPDRPNEIDFEATAIAVMLIVSIFGVLLLGGLCIHGCLTQPAVSSQRSAVSQAHLSK